MGGLAAIVTISTNCGDYTHCSYLDSRLDQPQARSYSFKFNPVERYYYFIELLRNEFDPDKRGSKWIDKAVDYAEQATPLYKGYNLGNLQIGVNIVLVNGCPVEVVVNERIDIESQIYQPLIASIYEYVRKREDAKVSNLTSKRIISLEAIKQIQALREDVQAMHESQP